MTTLQIRELDLTDRAEFDAWHQVSVRAIQQFRPTFVPVSADELHVSLATPPSGARRVDLVAFDGDRLVGTAEAWLPMEDNLDIAWLQVYVDPEHQNRGHGTQLCAAIEAVAEGRPTLLCELDYPPDLADPANLAFARARGYEHVESGGTNAMAWPPPAGLLASLRPQVPAEYAIETYVDGVPEAYRESLGVLKGLVDVDAPTGEQEFEASPETPEYYQAELERTIRRGGHQVETVAVHGGEVVAYTETTLYSTPERPASVQGTIVAAAHRGHRLGLAVKVANYEALEAMGLSIPRIDTGNDNDNRWMLAINEALGFRLSSRCDTYRKKG